VATKAQLRELVVERWVEGTMAPLRAVVASKAAAPTRLRQLFETLIAIKRRRAANDPELFAAFRTLAAETQSVASSHVAELVSLAATVIRAGVKEGTFRKVDPKTAGRSVLYATIRFHHPAHAGEWGNPGTDAAFEGVWKLVMDGLRAPGRPTKR
jgi:AcrR family transcriptional regulator